MRSQILAFPCLYLSAFLLLFGSIHWHCANASSILLNIPDFLRQKNEPIELPSKRKPGHQAANWTPWTYQPFCIEGASGLSKKYCVFTKHHAGRDSMSLITTPEVAAKTIEYLADDPLSIFLSPKQKDKWSWANRPYGVTDIPGKGKGVVATRLIRKYDTFMIDEAAIAADIVLPNSMTHSKKVQLFERATSQLINPGIVTNLSRKATVGGNVVDEVMLMNSFDTDVAEVPHMALFPYVARINHACRPNAFVMFSPSGLSVAIKAYHDIQPGEEITISYVILGKTSADRHDGLKRWGFTCTCDMCSASRSEIATSDARRKRVENAQKEMTDAWRTGKAQKAIKLGHEIIDLLEKEGLTPMLTEQYVILARLYLALDERKEAEEYSELALEVLRNHGFLGTADEEWDLERLIRSFS
ncbi:SET domain-containing protein [Zopfia rhizophila CBS 207.26]|uniref:SET domain-containing protein n=1 Tax=Zopfia rhizophila CBS 207.26 TaxID=1314779 RepID=A0A6A6EP26_9PEZI|nr:SET domain-containing protein [Zopfia rhizophila CBS 207.26]